MGSQCSRCAHCAQTEWGLLDERQLARLDAGRRVRKFLPGEVLFHEGDEQTGIYCVLEGLVGLRKVDSGGESALLRLIGPGGTFGFRSLLADEPHGVSAEVMKGTRVCHVLPGPARRVVAEDHGLVMRFFRHLARDMAASDTRVLETVTASCRVRFLRLILNCGTPVTGVSGDARMSLDLPLSRQDFASMIGIRPESMSRLIRNIEGEGLARFSGRRVEILDLARMASESESQTIN